MSWSSERHVLGVPFHSPASEDVEQAERHAGIEEKQKAKGAKKMKKRQTEVERLGGSLQDEPGSRRSIRTSLNRAENSADEAGFGATDEDVSGPTEFW